MEPVDRREQILAVAMNLFSEKGIDGTSLRDIATTVGISQPSLYHYFASKEALIEAVLRSTHEKISRYHRAGMQMVWEAPSLGVGLKRLAEVMLSQWEIPSNRSFQRVIMSEMAQGGPLAALVEREFVRPRRTEMARLFQELIDGGRIRPLDPELLALQFVGPILFACMISQAGEETGLSPERLRELAFQHLDVFVRGVEK